MRCETAAGKSFRQVQCFESAVLLPLQYIPKRHLQPADLPKPPARTLRAKHGGHLSGASPSGSRAASVKTMPSTGSLPRMPSLDSQASPPYPSVRHPLHRCNPPLRPPWHPCVPRSTACHFCTAERLQSAIPAGLSWHQAVETECAAHHDTRICMHEQEHQ